VSPALPRNNQVLAKQVPTSHLHKRAATELVGTYLLILFGCGAMMVNASSEAITHVGVAAAWGAIVAILIYAIGDLSGAHLNPAVSIALVVARKFTLREACVYVPAQCLGATLAALTLSVSIPDAGALVGSTFTQMPLGTAWAVEAMMTAVLLFVVLGTTSTTKDKSSLAGLAIGATIGLEALVAGPLTKASMNPARSLGPAIVSTLTQGSGPPIQQLWLYLSAPLIGAIAGVLVYQSLDHRFSDESADRQ
jgi:MIP family channel proteins